MNSKYIREEIKLDVGTRQISITIISPKKNYLATNATILLTLSMERGQALYDSPYNVVSDIFLENGHRVVSFDLPNHGERVNKYGSDIVGWRNSFIDGDDPFEMFLEDANELIDMLISKKYAKEGKIIVSGISRAGYLALRLLSNDNRILAAAAFAPVTDWIYLREFDKDKRNIKVKNTKIENYIGGLVKKPIYIAIGCSDQRVSTNSCKRFYKKLIDCNNEYDYSNIKLHITEDKSHLIDMKWRKLGAKFLLDQVNLNSEEVKHD